MKIKSIMSTDKRCFVCGSTQNIHLHHVFFGTGLRKISDDNGFTCYLCAHHHNQSAVSVHNNRELDLILKRRCQKIFETYHTREEFMQLIGRNYLD